MESLPHSTKDNQSEQNVLDNATKTLRPMPLKQVLIPVFTLLLYSVFNTILYEQQLPVGALVHVVPTFFSALFTDTQAFMEYLAGGIGYSLLYLPVFHIAIASISREKRKSHIRRKIMFNWTMGLIVLHVLVLISYVIVPTKI